MINSTRKNDPADIPVNKPDNKNEAFGKLYDVVARLRASGGCPWDREQTPLSLRGALIEETYECVEAINEQDPAHIKEELGDIFLLVTMIAYMHEEEGLFSVAGALEGITEKLIRRHPHVFNESEASGMLEGRDRGSLSSAEVLRNWAKIKVEREGRKPKDSILDEVSRGLPQLDRAWKLQKKASKAGFDWPDAAGVIAKINEELKETEDAIKALYKIEKEALRPEDIADGKATSAAAQPHKAGLEEELGDLLFSVVNLCRFFDVEPSVALQRTNVKFTERFRYVEKRMKESGREMNAQNLALMDQYWEEAKTCLSPFSPIKL